MANEVLPGNVMLHCGDEQKLQKFYGGLLVGKCAGRSAGLLSAAPPVRDSCLRRNRTIFAPPGPSSPESSRNRCILTSRWTMLRKWSKGGVRGAQKAAAQFGGRDFVTMPDPAGHPFCLCRKGRSGQHNLKAAF